MSTYLASHQLHHHAIAAWYTILCQTNPFKLELLNTNTNTMESVAFVPVFWAFV